MIQGRLCWARTPASRRSAAMGRRLVASIGRRKHSSRVGRSAIPPLKGGSSCSIPHRRRFRFRSAVSLLFLRFRTRNGSGFAVDWTAAAKKEANSERKRWRQSECCERSSRRVGSGEESQKPVPTISQETSNWRREHLATRGLGVGRSTVQGIRSAWPVRDEFVYLARFLSGQTRASICEGYARIYRASRSEQTPLPS